MKFGDHMREWRQTRRVSQMELAADAGISARHLSFLETGRSRPTEGMIMRLAEALDLPLGAKNELFAAAGYAPRFGEPAASGLEGLSDEVRSVLELILERHAPWPAACLNADYELLGGNSGFAALAASLGVAPGADLLSLVMGQGPVREAITNWPEFAAAFMRRADAEARFYGPRSRLAQKLARYRADPDLQAAMDRLDIDHRPPPLIEIGLRLGGAATRWITTVTTLGSAQDVLLEGIFIEQYFPADEETRAFASAFAEAP